MKKILYILLFIALFSACSEEVNIQDINEDNRITLKVFNSPMTKAQDDEIDWESHLTRLDIFFYEKGNTRECVYYDYIDDTDYLNSTTLITLNVVEEQINEIFKGNDICEVFVIANLPEAVYSRIKADENPISTDFNTLSALTLDFQGNYNKSGCDFIMAGHDGSVTKDPNNNAAGTVKLTRTVSKITLKINVPEQITLDNGVVMKPILTEKVGESSTKVTPLTAIHNAVNYGVLFPSGVVDQDMFVVPEDWYFTTDGNKTGYDEIISETQASDGSKKYQLTCSAPFYSYPNAWERGGEHAAYLTLEMPWKNTQTDVIDTYYYQILINGQERRLNPNSWYNMTVNVGVIGSSVESHPETLKDISFYILDWTDEPMHTGSDEGDSYEEVEIKEYTYLIVHNDRLEINNASSGVIKFSASHNIGVKLNTTSRPVEGVDGFNSPEGAGAFYINCKGNRPVITKMDEITVRNNFTVDNNSGTLTFTNEITRDDDIYSPVYVYATIWLETDGTDGMSEAERAFSEEITIVQYPAIYILPTRSTSQSVYINNQTGDTSISIKVDNETYPLGKATGTNSTQGFTHEAYMFTIAVSSFNDKDTFTINGNTYSYIIGDPRDHTSNKDLNNDNKTIPNGNDGWRSDSNNKYLTNYYPTLSASTNTADSSFDECRLISPKFKIASMFGGYSSSCTHEGAAMRCASYQEDGYPAGRWRLPTTAEVLFVIELQAAESIQNLFYGGNYYYSASHSIRCQTNGVTISEPVSNGSVRCVYDEWYWGTNRDAKEGAKNAEGVVVGADGEARTKDDYFFTWGDEKIW